MTQPQRGPQDARRNPKMPTPQELEDDTAEKAKEILQPTEKAAEALQDLGIEAPQEDNE